ncbi:MAG: amidohydrolase [Sphingomonadales bacterium]|nr:amidohydrolase [Sphingomonadales bacterium]
MLRRRTFLVSALGAAAASALPEAVFAQHRKPPFKLYDTHAHFYTNDFDKYPIDGSTARYGAEALIAKAKAHPQTPEVIFREWDATGVAKGCGVQYGSAYSNDNRYLLDISRQHPRRIVPVVILDPVAPDTPATLERMARQDRISGVRFRGMPNMPDGTHNFLTAPSAPVWDAANRLGLVVVLMPHSRKVEDRRGVMKQIADLAVRYPNVIIVLDHMGFPVPTLTPTYGFYPEHLALIEHKNVYFKYTQLLIEQLTEGKVPRDAFLEYSARTFGPERMMWGSDVGNSEGTMQEFVHLALESAKRLTLKQQKTLFFDTPERIFVPGGRGPAKA